MATFFSYFAILAHFCIILQLEHIQSSSFLVKICYVIIKYNIEAFLKSDVPYLKIKDFGENHTYLISIPYCLNELTLTFQIIKCPLVRMIFM